MENGYDELNLALAQLLQQLRANCKSDAKALFLIQSTLEHEIFPQIAAATSHEAWEILKNEYLCNNKVITVKLQTLR